MGSGASSEKKTSVPAPVPVPAAVPVPVPALVPVPAAVPSSSVTEFSTDADLAAALHASELEAKKEDEARKADQLQTDQCIAASLVTDTEVSHVLPYNENEQPEEGLSQEQIDLLPTHNYAGHGSHNNKCHICPIAYKIGDLLRTLPCCHIFHSACICDWIKTKNTCPLCLKSITEMLSSPPESAKRPPNSAQPLTPTAPPLE